MPRFALLTHDSPRGLHYDLLLEAGDVLKTWALPQLPAFGVEMECDALPDHRLLYLDYEGPVSGNRGNVVRWDSGTFDIVNWGDDEVVVELAGQKLAGRIELRRLAEQGQRWRLVLRAAHS